MFKVPWSPHTRAQSEARSDCSQSGPHPHLLIVGVTPGCLWSEEALKFLLHPH